MTSPLALTLKDLDDEPIGTHTPALVTGLVGAPDVAPFFFEIMSSTSSTQRHGRDKHHSIK